MSSSDLESADSRFCVLHIGERSEMLLPKDAGGRTRATQWLIAALNSIEPFVMNVALIDVFYANEEWAKLRRPGAVEFVPRSSWSALVAAGEAPFSRKEDSVMPWAITRRPTSQYNCRQC